MGLRQQVFMTSYDVISGHSTHHSKAQSQGYCRVQIGALPVIRKSLPVCLKFDKNVGKRPQRGGICDVIMTSYSDILHTNRKLRFRTIVLIANQTIFITVIILELQLLFSHLFKKSKNRRQSTGICDVIMTSYSDVLEGNRKLRPRSIH